MYDQPELNTLFIRRCHLELLKSIISTYKELRRVGQEIARQTEQQQAAAKASAALAAGMGVPGMNKVDHHALGMEEYQALEALVGLRFAIACMHARKSYQGLIRQRYGLGTTLCSLAIMELIYRFATHLHYLFLFDRFINHATFCVCI
ncbi:hypothetical protein EON65_03025 [archaeon]|nr:MAG: hypothetical protein EON65_03025 [archaeon]